MTSTKFYSAEEKEKVFKKFQVFFERGCPASGFTKLLYKYASNMYGHIAHYNLGGYYDTWFTSPAKIAEWLTLALRNPCYGDPAFTFSDVERELQVWIRESGMLSRYVKEANDKIEKEERAELVRLQGKYGMAV